MPTFLIDHFWPGMLVWSLLYISDYALTIACARLYRGQETVIFEGSYEITPFFQRDIDSLRVVSPRFVFMLFLSVGALGFLWILNRESSPELYQFALGALIGVQLAIHMRHLRNLVLLRTISQPGLVRGQIEYGRMGMLRASSWEWFAFSGFFLMLFALTQSWFMAGSSLGCLSLGIKHRRLASKVQTNLAEWLNLHSKRDKSLVNRVIGKVGLELTSWTRSWSDEQIWKLPTSSRPLSKEPGAIGTGMISVLSRLKTVSWMLFG